MSVKYDSHLVAGFCLLPTYLMAGLLLSGVNVLLWFVGIIVVMFLCSAMYHALVLRPSDSSPKIWIRYWVTFVVQIIFWVVILFVFRIKNSSL